ncbi:MAG: XTP/dITP diphosphatase [Bacillota bacterium]|jgi:XTP/dITP diphosphohydrolase
MEKLVVATKNQGKLREVKALLADYPLEVLSLKDFPDLPEIEETGSTFAENALIKATTVAKQTGLLTLGDDSGLEVDCLDGRPGVLSARFAGEPASDWRNNQKLLALMAGIAPEKRTARFRCVVAIVEPTGQSYLAEGTCEGQIGYAMVGDQGFGYDPLFIIPGSGLTLAQLNMASKNKISHRSQALKQAIPILLSILKR